MSILQMEHGQYTEKLTVCRAYVQVYLHVKGYYLKHTLLFEYVMILTVTAVYKGRYFTKLLEKYRLF